MLDSIKDSFTESIQIQIAAAEALPDAIMHAAQAMVASFLTVIKFSAAVTVARRSMHNNLFLAF